MSNCVCSVWSVVPWWVWILSAIGWVNFVLVSLLLLIFLRLVRGVNH